ncbi:hypothetical protein ASG01_00785 [Chryseobacterium sp. Leaf180]|nr:hypothetical protein ASG01_00785 [Chryseobacterium sp. Leaf180]
MKIFLINFKQQALHSAIHYPCFIYALSTLYPYTILPLGKRQSPAFNFIKFTITFKTCSDSFRSPFFSNYSEEIGQVRYAVFRLFCSHH